MTKNSDNGKLVLLAVPLGFAMYSYYQNYSLTKGAFITVLGSVAVGVVLGTFSVAYMGYKIANKDYLK
jgi:hypothetical protein